MTKFRNGFGNTSLLSEGLLERLGIPSERVIKAANDYRQHIWVSVVDPTNQRSILHACDDCGVVKSENSVVRNCKADYGVALISSSAISKNVQMAV